METLHARFILAIALNPIEAVKRMRGAMHSRRGNHFDTQDFVIPTIIACLPRLFAADPLAGQRAIRAILQYNSIGEPKMHDKNIREIVVKIPEILEAGPQNGRHAVIALMDHTSMNKRNDLALLILRMMPELALEYPLPVQEMLDVVETYKAGRTNHIILSNECARLSNVWYVPAIGKNGKVKDVIALSGHRRASVRDIPETNSIRSEGLMIASMFHGRTEPMEIAVPFRQRGYTCAVLAF